MPANAYLLEKPAQVVITLTPCSFVCAVSSPIEVYLRFFGSILTHFHTPARSVVAPHLNGDLARGPQLSCVVNSPGWVSGGSATTLTMSAAAKIKRYGKLGVLGKGSFGTVYLVVHNEEKRKYALKKIKLHGIPKAEKDATQMELDLLQTLRHPGIVGYKESFEVKKGTPRYALCIVMQLCDGGELAEYLERVCACCPLLRSCPAPRDVYLCEQIR